MGPARALSIIMNFTDYVAKTVIGKQVIKNNPQDIKPLIPVMQKTRSYKDVEPKSIQPIEKLNLTLMRYRFGEDKGEWKMKWYVQWPFFTPINKSLGAPQVKAYAEEYLRTSSERGDDKYIEIESADSNYIVYVWNMEKWLNDNFKSVAVKYHPPTTLAYKFKISVPLFIFSHASLADLSRFVGDRFSKWLGSHKSKFETKWFGFLKKVTPDLFDWTTDFQMGEIRASLKYSVILTSLAAYMLFFHKKSFPPKEFGSLKKQVAKLSSVDDLEKNLKNL
jgi:hypothetical protein